LPSLKRPALNQVIDEIVPIFYYALKYLLNANNRALAIKQLQHMLKQYNKDQTNSVSFILDFKSFEVLVVSFMSDIFKIIFSQIYVGKPYIKTTFNKVEYSG